MCLDLIKNNKPGFGYVYPTDLYTGGGGLLIDALPMLTKHHVCL